MRSILFTLFPISCAVSKIIGDLIEYLKKRDTLRKNAANEVGGAVDDESFLDLEQTRTLFGNILPKLCYRMTPHDLNVAIMMELSLYHPPRGGKSMRLWHIGLFKLIHTADPPYIQVSLPSDLKNTNAAQCETNENIRPFRLEQSGTLYKLIRMHHLGRGQHITETALFLHPYHDNKWRVCTTLIFTLSNNIKSCNY